MGHYSALDPECIMQKAWKNCKGILGNIRWRFDEKGTNARNSANGRDFRRKVAGLGAGFREVSLEL